MTTNSGLLANFVSLGYSSNKIWNLGPVASPLIIGPGQWSGSNRTLASGTAKSVLINYNGSITPGSGTWTYTVIAGWDDVLGGPVCTSLPVMVTLP